ncbi:MAG: glycosyltransferase [Proteobacteria bacterium]|nr:glycosyltransferase [Pseudomonadota bacterium]
MPDPGMDGARAKLSALVISYNREAIVGTCLRALAFADEIVVVDKSSTDRTPEIAAGLADRVVQVPWSPSVEETRAMATDLCTHDWILFLDDDECLSPEAVRFIDAELRAPRADIYRLPLRHYILGVHDERAYYWPERHVRMFRRPALDFVPTVHGGIVQRSDRVFDIADDGGACIHHLSHQSVAQWIDKSNRYTSRPDRVRCEQEGSGIVRFAHARIDHWRERTKPSGPDEYPAALAVLRATYDLIDRLKGWEEEAGLDGAELFRAACARLDAAYASELADLARPRAGAGAVEAAPVQTAPTDAEAEALRQTVAALRATIAAQRAAVDAARMEADAARASEAEQRAHAAAMQAWAESARRQTADFEKLLADFAAHHDRDIAERTAETERLRVALAGAQQDAEAQRAHVAALNVDVAALNAHVVALLASTSWRISAPMRAIARMLGRR